MKITRLLAFRLFLVILIVVLVGMGIFTTLTVRRLQQRTTESLIVTAARISDIIKRSTHYSMLLNRREDIYQSITTIGTEPGIHAIRIYNKKGEITFSTQVSDVGKVVDRNAEACTGCHASSEPPRDPKRELLTRTFTSSDGNRVLGIITPIHNDPTCTGSECHAHEASQTVLGVLDVMLPLEDYDEALSREIRSQYLGGLLLLLAITSAAAIFLWLLVERPARELTRGTQEIMRGNLSHRIVVRSKDEIGTLAASFNKMTSELSTARDEVTQWTRTLEERVKQKTDELQKAQDHLIRMEKMASLGRLSATVAHELNNPLEGILTYAKLIKKRLTPGTLSASEAEEIQNELSLIADETARCGNIVKNLLLFSRQRPGELRHEDLHAVIRRTLKLIEHHLTMHSITLVEEFDPQPLTIECLPQEIEQALLALEINAIEAMPAGGTLTVGLRSHADGQTVEIIVGDTGVGIAEEDLPHVFEPFFTTKKEGKGTGLGLSVVFGIVERHGGSIDMRSAVGIGTTVAITLPRHSQRRATSPVLSDVPPKG